MDARFDLRQSWLPALLAAAALALGSVPASASSAQTVHEVPGDFAVLQQAIDAAAAGDVVLVHGGDHEGPITIDRPLTLIGEPRPRIHPPGTPFAVFQPAALRLDGAGNGKVVLCNLEVRGYASGEIFGECSPAVEGGGFDELHVIDCELEGPYWYNLTGFGAGTPALATDIPEVLIASSSLEAGSNANDACYGFAPPGPPGIDAPASSVVVLDSTVRGGEAAWLCWFECPTQGSAGGPGIVAEELWDSGSEFQGGSGGRYYIESMGQYELCGQGPAGPAMQVAQHALLEGELAAEESPRLGREWALSWNTSGSTSLLLVSFHPRVAPISLPAGPLFMEAGSAVLAQPQPLGSGSFDLRIPLDGSLMGSELVAQVYAGKAGLTRPLLDVLRPAHARPHAGP